MKVSVIAFAALIAFAHANLPTNRILDPDFLFPTAWDTQKQAQALQNKFDQAYIDAHGKVSEILGSTMQGALVIYQNHTSVAFGIYEPVYTLIEALPDSPCRTGAIGQLQFSLTNAGLNKALCVQNYHGAAKNESDGVVDVINDLNEEYLRLSRFVYQSFVGQNALLDGEKIKDNIVATLAEFIEKFDLEAVDHEAFRNKLKDLDRKLYECFVNTHALVQATADFMRLQIVTCQNLNPRASRTSFRSYMPEIEEAVKNFQPYQW